MAARPRVAVCAPSSTGSTASPLTGLDPPRRSSTRPPARSRPRCCWRRPPTSHRGASAHGGVRDWSQASLSDPLEGAVRLPRAGERARRRAGRAHHRRARQGALRRRGRGAARPRGRRVRLRHPAPAQGRLLRPGLRRRRRLLLPRAARRRRRASPRSTSRSWCRCGCTRSPSRAATRSCSSPASATRPASQLIAPSCGSEAGLPDGVFNVVHGDKEAVDALLDHPTSPRSRSSARPRSPGTSTSAARRNGKRVQALGGAKNHAIVLPDADVDFAAEHLAAAAFGSAGERCMAISAAVAVGERRRRHGRGGRGQGARGAGRPGPRRRQRDGPGRHRRRARPHRRAHRHAATAQGATLAVDGRGLTVAGHEDGFWVGPTVIDHVDARDGRLHRGDLRPGAVGRPRRHGRRGDRADQRQPLRQRHRDLHRSAARRPAGSSAACTSA